MLDYAQLHSMVASIVGYTSCIISESVVKDLKLENQPYKYNLQDHDFQYCILNSSSHFSAGIIHDKKLYVIDTYSIHTNESTLNFLKENAFNYEDQKYVFDSVQAVSIGTQNDGVSCRAHSAAFIHFFSSLSGEDKVKVLNTLFFKSDAKYIINKNFVNNIQQGGLKLYNAIQTEKETAGLLKNMTETYKAYFCMAYNQDDIIQFEKPVKLIPQDFVISPIKENELKIDAKVIYDQLVSQNSTGLIAGVMLVTILFLYTSYHVVQTDAEEMYYNNNIENI